MRSQRGFTLIELMIVVVVISILAAIAIPNFLEQSRKGKRAEAAQALSEVQLMQARYRADNATYGTLDQLFGTAAKATAYNNALQYYSVAVSGASGTDYTLTATRKNPGAMANDPK